MTVSYRVLPGVSFGPLGDRIRRFVEKYYPNYLELYVTSAYRPQEGGSHHSGLFYGGSPTAAVDFGAYDDSESNDKDQRDMGLFADWLFEHFWDLTVELIHTQPHNDHFTYVKNQQRVGAYATADHVNHVHFATSAALMDEIEARARSLWGEGNTQPPADGSFSLPDGHYYGLITGPAESHGGYHPSERPAILLIQNRLQALGYAPNVPGWADGLFEAPTEEAVRNFQEDAGLPVTGRVDLATWDRLFDESNPPNPGEEPPVTDLVFGCDIYDFTVDRGLTEEDVRGFVREGGLKFINAKFIETYPGGQSPHFEAARMLRAAVDEGLPFPCGFIVPRTGVSVHVQVDELLEFADANFPQWRTHPGFFWQVDSEHWSDGGEVYDAVDVNLSIEVLKFLINQTGRPAVLYAPDWTYGDTIPDYPGRKLWSSDYRDSGASRDYREMYIGDEAHCWDAYSGTVPVIGQYCSDGQVNGWGPLVMSVFRGSEDDFRAMLASTLPGATPPDPDPPADTVSREEFDRAVSALTSAVHELSNRCLAIENDISELLATVEQLRDIE